MKALLQWLDDRTGLVSCWRQHQQASCSERPSWLGLWSSAILFTFVMEAVTGFFLWAFYSTSAQSAWESIYYVQYEVMGGWLVRGIHYYAGQVLLGLIGLYVLSMIFTGAYRAPRELVFWLAVGMGAITIALLLTGDLLTWSQRGYWSTDVRTKFLFLLPGIGGELYKLAVGGPGMGHLTITRFLALHAGLFTAIFGALLWLHARWTRQAAEAETAAGQAPLPPRANQAQWNALGCVAVMAIVLAATVWGGVSGGVEGQSPADYLGAELGAPRDPGDAYAAARPDWYFVGLYQFAHYFSGAQKIVPIFVVPGLLVGYFLVMPFLAKWKPLHGLNILTTLALLVAIGALTAISKQRDRDDPAHQRSLAAAEEDAVRVKQLIQRAQGIPSGGALPLLWDDPKTQGHKLFTQHCLSCHDCADAAGNGLLAEKPSAPNLHTFASVEWLTGFLDPKQITYAPAVDPETGKLLSVTDRPKYFGTTKLVKGSMTDFVKGSLRELRKDVGDKEFRKLIATVAAEANRKPGTKPSDEVKQAIGDFTCFDCHQFHGECKTPTGPDLTGYGSKDWLVAIISDPAHARFYKKNNDRMPSYAKNVLSARQIEMIAEWLRGEWYEPPSEANAE